MESKINTYPRKFLFFTLFILSFIFQVTAQDFRTVRDGIEYAAVNRGTKAEPIHINLLRLDLKKVRLDVVHALDSAIGLEKTSSMAVRHGAFAAINAGFFRLDRSIFAGDPVSVLMIDNHHFSESYANRVALLISNKPDQTEVDIRHFSDNHFVRIGKREIQLTGLNRERREDEIVKYTSVFARTTLTNPGGVEVIVRNGKIVQILSGKGSSEIPQNGFVISASGRKREEILKFARVGASVKSYVGILSSAAGEQKTNLSFAFAEDAVGGLPQLIRNGAIEITWEQEKAGKSLVETRHPRTAVARLKDGKFLMVAVDGRQPDHSVGMSLPELAAFLLEMGALDAMNLDGGGSTTMFLGGKVVNRPSDKEGERNVGDAILVFPR